MVDLVDNGTQEDVGIMAGKGVRDSYTALAFSKSIADMFWDQTYSKRERNKTSKALLDRVRAAVDNCFAVWPDKLCIGSKDEVRIYNKMEVFRKRYMASNGYGNYAVFYTSFCLELLVNLMFHINKGKNASGKVAALDKLIASVRALQNYLDRSDDGDESRFASEYERAHLAACAWCGDDAAVKAAGENTVLQGNEADVKRFIRHASFSPRRVASASGRVQQRLIKSGFAR